ncbi:hypothetical protein BpHYR1_043527 [Brachionus plicatilis]|uniref:OTU domain-containing protein n=1 Tax=Brachionus plicatilis TaxID=10195 RepID=A0A3M7R940_BRAPC|nr:hypothetical protein BpHYR1_043527 [Brachionus plicatilis]
MNLEINDDVKTEKNNNNSDNDYDSNLQSNPFYLSKLYDLIAEQLYLMPLWCGIIPEIYAKSNNNCLSECFKTRLTNNPVEKSKILGGLISKKEEWSDKKAKNKKQAIYYDSKPTAEKDLFEYDPMFLEKESKEYTEIFETAKICIEEKFEEPMEISQEEIQFDFKRFNEFYHKISNEVWDFDGAKTFFESKQTQNIKQSIVYSGQNLDESRCFSIIVELFNLNGFVPIRTLGDGNCFYRSISTLLFGTDEYYYLHYYVESYETICCKSMIKNEWAMMLNILATSILLNREILIFNLNTETLVPYCYKYLIGENNCENLKIGFASNHFVTLVCKEIHNSPFLENYILQLKLIMEIFIKNFLKYCTKYIEIIKNQNITFLVISVKRLKKIPLKLKRKEESKLFSTLEFLRFSLNGKI